jgi:cytochrome c oxidase subunit 2
MKATVALALLILLCAPAQPAPGSRLPVPGARAPQSPDVRRVAIVAERFDFSPSRITVPRGTTLELEVTSEDTLHGFRIQGSDVNVAVPKRGRGSVRVTFHAGTPGRYTFECSRMCGAGHNFMRGEIRVLEVPAR